MNHEHVKGAADRTREIALWEIMLRDDAALLDHPGAHHKALLTQAHALHRAQVIDQEDLSDLLEQADGALAYAVEALLDRQNNE
ncbi:hypothetical protein [Pseudomonas violetae]|uniref:Uncharacterized protein n=1 Tax=Pseudomonas violetae TaxID=2915813 RepID=A0ABT0EVA0_9PSED|nr:hypothetical protein [Pseudomonas violetae]MCK1789663.1 hypothetical protein [Pseudomonas violetae]